MGAWRRRRRYSMSVSAFTKAGGRARRKASSTAGVARIACMLSGLARPREAEEGGIGREKREKRGEGLATGWGRVGGWWVVEGTGAGWGLGVGAGLGGTYLRCVTVPARVESCAARCVASSTSSRRVHASLCINRAAAIRPG